MQSLTPDLLARCFPQQSDPSPTFARQDPQSLYKKAREVLKTKQAYWKNALQNIDPDVVRHMNDAAQGLQQSPPTFDALQEGQSLALAVALQLSASQNAESLQSDGIAMLIQRGGWDGALRAMLEQSRWFLSQDSEWKDSSYTYKLNFTADPPLRYGHRYPGWSPVACHALRIHLAGVPPEQWQAARQMVEERWASLKPTMQIYMAFVLDDPELAARCMPTGDKGAPLLACLRDASLLTSYKDFGLLSECAYYTPTLLRRVGGAAEGFVMEMLAETNQTADGLRQLILMASLFSKEKLAERLVPFLDVNALRKTASEGLIALGDISIAPLEAVKGRQKEVAHALAAAIRQATQPKSILPDATDVPAVLRQPPWRQKVKREKPLIMDVETPKVEGKFFMNAATTAAMQNVDIPARPADFAKWFADGRDVSFQDCQWMTEAELEQAQKRVSMLTFLRPDPSCIIVLLDRFGMKIMPQLVQYLKTAPSYYIDNYIFILSRVTDPAVAPWLVKAWSDRRYRPMVRSWLSLNPHHSALGLIPLCFKEEDRETSELLLRMLHISHPDAIPMALGAFPEAVQKAIQNLLQRDPLSFFPAKIPSIPSWWNPNALPPLLTRSGGAIQGTPLEALREMLAFSSVELPYAGVEQVRQVCDPHALESWLQAFYGAWVLAGAPPAQTWVRGALVQLGTDLTARWIAGRFVAWSHDSKARAKGALEVLALLGTDASLSWLGRIARSGQAQWSRDHASELMKAAAAEQGLSFEELEDRTAPDLELDEDGSCVLDFGPRQFRVGFDGMLVPFVRDSDGSLLKQLPRSNKNDDPALAKAATERWKAMKEDAAKVAGTQLERMERALATERRWTEAEFMRFFVQHPLIGHLSQRLLWGVWAQGQRGACFRVAEDRSFSDIQDAPFNLPPNVQIGLVHPIELSVEERTQWTQMFADYGIVQPFQQLSRNIRWIAPEELDRNDLPSLLPRRIETAWLLSLRRKYWRLPYDRASEMFKYQGTVKVTLSLGDAVDASNPGLVRVRSLSLPPQQCWRQLSRVLCSEVVSDIENMPFEP